MSPTRGSTINSLQAIRRLSENSSALSRAFERLSSGSRINRASDDAAGLSLSSNLKVDSRIFNQGIRNLNDGISALSIASSALEELSQIVTRQQELAEQSANGTYSVTQRRVMQKEVDALNEEYNRVIATTKFNDIALLDRAQRTGSIRLQGGTGVDGGIAIDIGDSIDRNVGNGTFATAVSYAGAGGNPLWVHTADVNRDGNADVLYNEAGSLSVRLGAGDGTLGAATNYAGNFADFILKDLNSDGIADVVGADNATGSIFVRRGVGDGTFASAVTYTTGNNTTRVTAGDFNNDGIVDLAATSMGSSKVFTFLGQGDGTFSSARTINVNGDPDGIAAGDVNNDGNLDLVIGKRTALNYGILYGTGNGNFSSETLVTTTENTRFVQLADWSRDGIQDLLIGSFGVAPPRNTYYLNNGQGTFSAQLSVAGDHPAEPADLNGDGYLDIGASNTTYGFTTHLNNRDGTFGAQTQTSTSAGAIYTAFADLNNDGALDAITSQYIAGGKIFVSLANSTPSSSVAALSILTAPEARESLVVYQRRLEDLSRERSNIGAAESRLSIYISNLESAIIHTEAAAARITDVDIAQETSELVRRKILVDIGASIVAQANQSSEILLKLLRTD